MIRNRILFVVLAAALGMLTAEAQSSAPAKAQPSAGKVPAKTATAPAAAAAS